jgi:hypothetical protein
MIIQPVSLFLGETMLKTVIFGIRTENIKRQKTHTIMGGLN